MGTDVFASMGLVVTNARLTISVALQLPTALPMGNVVPAFSAVTAVGALHTV